MSKILTYAFLPFNIMIAVAVTLLSGLMFSWDQKSFGEWEGWKAYLAGPETSKWIIEILERRY
jgi:hypothetical protein